jgi:hypothetical protein
MAAPPHLSSCRERGAALIIVLAFVVLLTGLMVAYVSRATSDRTVAQSSLHQTKADQVAASGMDLVIGGLRQEITGPSPTPTPPYVPATNARMLPLRSGNPAGAPDPVPNLVRRSVRADPIPAPGISSFASFVNSTTDVSPNGRFITLPRWNKHYLVPKLNTGDDKTDPVAAFVAPDWVILTRNGAVAFSTWNSALADQTPTNNSYAVGRYAYAIYDEGQLLDMNVAGYPNGTTPDQAGRKGPVAYADLTVLPYPISNSISPYQIDRLVGWRNYATTQPTNNFPDTAPAFAANFRAGSGPASLYWSFIINNTAGFTSARSNPSPSPYPWNGRTDQMFLSRQQLIAFRAATQFSSNALQYLTTFSRELNAPSWKPSTPSAINPDLLNVRAVGTFTRASDGTSVAAGDLLINRRFPLSRINGLSDPTFSATANSTIVNGAPVPATAATVQRDFGLQWDNANTAKHWNYVGASGSTVQSAIETLSQVAAENREPNFFELLKAAILNGSVGLGSSGATFVAADPKYVSSDYQIMQIGANIIDQWDSDNVPTFINFGSPASELAGIENLPYLNKLVFKPYWTSVIKSGVTTYPFDAWLIPSLWNPHQQTTPATQNVQIAMTSGTFTASTTAPTGTTALLTGSASLFMTVDASKFGTIGPPPNPTTNNPSGPTTATGIKAASNPPDITISKDTVNYGFHVAVATPGTTAPSASTTAYPNFTACNFELQVQVSTSPAVWKAYQRWTAQPATTVVCQALPSAWLNKIDIQDPEFVTLDPRTVRFGVWGNDAFTSASPSGIDYTTGVLTTLDQSVSPPSPPTLPGVFEKITKLPPVGASFSTPASTDLYKYANNVDTTVHYTDPDGLQRQGDLVTTGITAMQPADWIDRPQILSRPFQSVAELGQVFRDQPWKTLDFTTASSPDVGLLDVFTLHESGNEGGKTSLNTRYQPILTAILSNAIKRLAGTNADVITTAQRDAIVTALFNITSANPMIRKTDLLAQLAADPSVTGLGNKEARELVMRAFSDATQTRTWNLLIDVIAQSGRYPTTANSLAGFLVEGEQHYWVHVAIDRFTGQVIDKQIEVVNE